MAGNGVRTQDFPLVDALDEVIGNKNGTSGRQALSALVQQVSALIVPANLPSLQSFLSQLEAEIDAASTDVFQAVEQVKIAKDTAISASRFDAIVADATERDALTVSAGYRVFMRSDRHLWEYNGSSWVDEGPDPTEDKVSYSDGYTNVSTVDGRPAVVDANGVEVLGWDSDGSLVFRLSPTMLATIASIVDQEILAKIGDVEQGVLATLSDGGLSFFGDVNLPADIDVNGVELRGFDKDTLDVVALGLRTPAMRLWRKGPGGAPAIIGRGSPEALGFDAQGRFLAEPSPDFSNKILRTANQLKTLRSIVCWGDSLTAGAFGEGTNYPAVLASELGIDVQNMGIGGTRTPSITSRQGGKPFVVTITGNELPAGTSEILVTDYDFDAYNNQTDQERSGVLNGVRAILKRYGVVGNEAVTDYYTVRRESAGVGTIPIAAGTQFIFDDAIEYRDRTQIIWAGRNDIPNSRATVTAYRDSILESVAHIRKRHNRFLVVSLTSKGSDEGATTLGWIRDSFRELKEYLGDHAVDLQDYMSQRAIYDAGITPTAQDLIDIEGGFIPASLRESEFNSGHFNATGYTMIGKFMARHIRAKGY